LADYRYNKPYSASWNGVHSKYEIIPDLTKPLPPNNFFVTNPYIIGMLDIRWDSPLDIAENSQWTILGINIYKANDSEAGPFFRINQNPIETLYYRDQTTNSLIADENVLSTISKGENSVADWVFKVAHPPIIKENSQNELLEDPRGIVLKIDNGDGQGLLNVPALKLNARTGEVFLITKQIYNPETKKIEEPRLPIGPNARCVCSYWYNLSLIRSDLVPRHFYKITTVGRDKFGNILETLLDKVMPINVYQLDKPHYVWKSIISKNRFLLEQFGERVKLFLRKEVGERCPNYSDIHQQAHNNCVLCYGTGILGGFYGPFDITIACPEAEKHINLTDVGLRLNFTFDSWMGPSPLIRTRDFIVRQTGERMTVGPVIPQGPKGAIFQQHFTLNYRDTKDILYKVPIHGYPPPTGDCRVNFDNKVPVSDDTRNVNQPVTDASPVIPEYKEDKPRAKTDKGRTIDYENVTW